MFVCSVEDGFDEKDYEGWTRMTEAFAKEYPEFMIVGDDLYTTNTELIQKGVANKSATTRTPRRLDRKHNPQRQGNCLAHSLYICVRCVGGPTLSSSR